MVRCTSFRRPITPTWLIFQCDPVGSEKLMLNGKNLTECLLQNLLLQMSNMKSFWTMKKGSLNKKKEVNGKCWTLHQ